MLNFIDNFKRKDFRVMPRGTVKWFSDEKGYGFIVQEDGQDLFVHFSSIQSKGYKTLKKDQKVSFDVVSTEKGLQAVNVVVLNEKS